MNNSYILKHSGEADAWFDRNLGKRRSFVMDYFLSIFPHNYLIESNVAEFGCGRGENLLFLKDYVHFIDGFDISSKATDYIKNLIRILKLKNKMHVKCINLCDKNVHLCDRGRGDIIS